MPDDLFADPDLASLYDRMNPWAACDDFYLDLVGSAQRVLDVGCGTGLLLRAARGSGHVGRLVGLDPAAAMLAQARRADPDVEWIVGDLTGVTFAGEFDLVVMNGHAFQVLLTDDEISESLRAIRRALAAGGRLAFETRNPAACAWLGWTDEKPTHIDDEEGPVTMLRRVLAVDGERVTFSHTFRYGDGIRVSRSTLRFAPVETLDRLLVDAGFLVADRYGDWDRSPVSDDSPEIITLAR